MKHDSPRQGDSRSTRQHTSPRKRAAVPHVPTPQAGTSPDEVEDGGTRLNKALSGAGVCSRRQADTLIAGGKVRVNGEVVTEMGRRVFPATDRIEVEGRLLACGEALNRHRHTYVMLNKPVQVVSTVRDPQGRTTILDILPDDLKTVRLYPVGRLDFFSEGLLLLTDDGDLTHRLTHPKWHLPKYYRVLVREDIPPAALTAMRSGMTLAEGDRVAPVEAYIIDRSEYGVELEMVLHQGINRQIRRMCRDLGLTVLRLLRIQQGPVELGNLSRGACRRLEGHEVKALRKAAGLS